MATYSDWITTSARIGASLGGVSGFFYAAYITATNPTLGWADVLDTVESVVAVLMNAVILGSFCIAIGALAGLVLGIVSSPLSSFTGNAGILPFRVNRREKNTEKLDRAS
jgi:hypothetical protein